MKNFFQYSNPQPTSNVICMRYRRCFGNCAWFKFSYEVCASSHRSVRPLLCCGCRELYQHSNDAIKVCKSAHLTACLLLRTFRLTENYAKELRSLMKMEST